MRTVSGDLSCLLTFVWLCLCASVVEEGVAFEHAVVELALFSGGSAEAPLELRVGAEHHHPPLGWQGPVGLTEGAVEGLGLLFLQQPLAVGGIGHQLAVLAAAVEFPGVGHLEADAVLHPGQRGVVPGQLHGGGVDVPAPDVIGAVELLVLGLLGGVQPQPGGQGAPPLGGKGAVQARARF